MALIANKKAADEEGRILRRQKQTNAFDIFDGSSSLYGAGIGFSVNIDEKTVFF